MTNYTISIGSKEARDTGLLNEDGTSKPVKKTVDPQNHRIIIELDEDQANEQT